MNLARFVKQTRQRGSQSRGYSGNRRERKNPIGDAMAATFYTEPVLTFDLDVFILLPSESGGCVMSLDALYGALRKRGYNEEGETVSIEGVPVQFLPAYNALIEEALEQTREIDYGGVPTRVVKAEISSRSVYRPGERRIARAWQCCASRLSSMARCLPTSESGIILRRNGRSGRSKRGTSQNLRGKGKAPT